MTKQRHKKIFSRDRRAAIIFFCLIAAPAAVSIFAAEQNAAIAAAENRTAAPWPGAPRTVADVNQLGAQVSDYLEDRFGLRSALIGLHFWFTDQMDIRVSGRQAIEGRDGWLFLATGDALEMHMGRTPFQPGEADAWLDAAAAIDDAVAAQGGGFAVLLTPQKASIYGEFLPDYIEAGSDPSRFDILIEAGRARGLDFVDVRGPMAAGKATQQLFYRSDTHWTGAGAFIAYEALMETIEVDDAIRLDARRVAYPEREFSGDLARMLNNPDKYAEAAPMSQIADAAPRQTSELDEFAFDAFKTKVITTGANDRPTLLLIGDSFAEALMPFLTESFGKVVFVHHHAGDVDPAFVERFPSDIVVLQMTERMLVNKLTFEQSEAVE